MVNGVGVALHQRLLKCMQSAAEDRRRRSDCWTAIEDLELAVQFGVGCFAGNACPCAGRIGIAQSRRYWQPGRWRAACWLTI